MSNLPGTARQRLPSGRMPRPRKENEMSQTNIIGLVALVLGGVLLFFAWRASNAPVEQISEALTGRYTDNTMWLMLVGVAGVVIGAGLLLRDALRG
jgi:uncharacterized membrane protein HdeD (DUF308 family)